MILKIHCNRFDNLIYAMSFLEEKGVKIDKRSSFFETPSYPDKKNRYGTWYYEMHDLGYNYRITDFQCALGYSQLKKLRNFVFKLKFNLRISL